MKSYFIFSFPKNPAFCLLGWLNYVIFNHVSLWKNLSTPLCICGINSTYQYFSGRVANFKDCHISQFWIWSPTARGWVLSKHNNATCVGDKKCFNIVSLKLNDCACSCKDRVLYQRVAYNKATWQCTYVREKKLLESCNMLYWLYSVTRIQPPYTNIELLQLIWHSV